MIYLEILAATLTLISVWFTTKRNIWSWLIGIWAVCLYALIFYNTNLYANFLLQSIFLIQGVAGMIVWYRNRESREKNKPIIVKVEKLSKKEKLIYIAPIVIIYLVVSYLLGTYANTSVPYIDSLVATLSLFANYLLVRRKVESWWIWIAADIIYIGLFISMGLYVSSALYFILLLISFKGLIDWKIALKKQS